jgi:hypothetical protein
VRFYTLSVAALALMGLVAAPALAGEKHERIDLSKVPSEARLAADQAVPGGHWSKACREKENHETVYELEGKDATNRRVEVEVYSDGKVREVETEIGVHAVPESYRRICSDKHPGFKPTGAEQVTRNGQIYAYDFEGKMNGRYVEVRVHAADHSVKVLTEEEEPED